MGFSPVLQHLTWTSTIRLGAKARTLERFSRMGAIAFYSFRAQVCSAIRAAERAPADSPS
jgi:hypothetical protein